MGGIAKGIGKVIGGIGKVIGGIVKGIVNFVGDVIGFVLNPFGAMDTPDVPDPGQQAQGVTVTKQGTNLAIPVVYGFRRVGGVNIFTETNGTSNKYLYVVYALCEGEIEGVAKVLVNDIELPLPSGGKYTAGTVHSVGAGRYKDRIKLQFFNGTESQGQSTLANEAATWGKRSRKLPGLAYAVMRFEWSEIKTQEDADNNPFSGGIPQVRFDILGKKVFDVRTHTAGNIELSAAYGSRTKTYSFNPASCLLDYLENPRYGAGLDKSEIHAESFRIAANKYEQTVNYTPSITGRALTMNAVVETNNKILDNVKILTAGARGIMPFVQGRYKLKVEDGGNATDITSSTVSVALDVDKDRIVGGITLDGERKGSKFNQVLVNYVDPDRDFTNQQRVFTVSGDETVDNEEELTGEFTFHTLTNSQIAFDLAEMIYNKSRKQRQIEFTGTQELMDVEVGDIIRVTDTILDLSLQTFRVTGLRLLPDGNVKVDAAEHDATLYPFTTGPQIEIPPPLYRPDEFMVIPYVRPLPENALGLFPPFDPDDSAGEQTGLPPSFDIPLEKLDKFDNFNRAYLAINYDQFINDGVGLLPLTRLAYDGGFIRPCVTNTDPYTELSITDIDIGAVPNPKFYSVPSYGKMFAFGNQGLFHTPKSNKQDARSAVNTAAGFGEAWPSDYPLYNPTVEDSSGAVFQDPNTRPDAYMVTAFDRLQRPILGYAKEVQLNTGVSYELTLCMPRDSFINEFIIERVNQQNGVVKEQIVYQLRQARVTGDRGDPFYEFTGIGKPLVITFTPRDPSDFIRVRWRKRIDTVQMDFADGSDLHEFNQTYPNGYTYGSGGFRRTGSNIEALLNYLQALRYGAAVSSGTAGNNSVNVNMDI